MESGERYGRVVRIGWWMWYVIIILGVKSWEAILDGKVTWKKGDNFRLIYPIIEVSNKMYSCYRINSSFGCN